MPEITEIAKDLWVVDFPMRLLGTQPGRRMVIVRLGDGSLQLHSPGPWNDDLKKSVSRLGRVSELIVPTNFHDTYLAETLQVFPEATWYAPAGFPKIYPAARPPKQFKQAPALWKTHLLWKRLEGIPKLNELVFLHRFSRTLLVADLVFNITEKADWWTRTYFKLNGSFNSLRPTLLFRTCIKNKAKFMASLREVMEWDFDRLIPTHGAIVETGARERLRAEFRL